MSTRNGARWPGVLLLAAGIGLTLVIAYQLMFSVYMLYDDEGYVLYSLNNFARYGALYDRVYTQYGPFFFLLWGDAARLLGFEWTHDLGRLFTIVNWVGTAGFCAWVCIRLTRSLVAGTLTLTLVFVHLWQMTSEPHHPGGTVAILLSGAAVAVVEALRRDKFNCAALLLGAVGAALALIKINVGVFFLASSFLWLWLLRRPETFRAALWNQLAILAAALMPPALMWRYLGEGWAAFYAVLAVTGILAAALVTARAEPKLFGLSALFRAGAAAVVVTLVTFGLTLAQGTTPAGLLDGVLLGPLRHSGAYHFGFNWRPGVTVIAGGSLALLGAWFLVRDEARRLRLRLALALLRLLLLAGFVACCFHPQPATLAYAMMLAAPMAWLCVIPLTDPTVAFHQPVRTWLGLMLAWQYLHAYPVAGSQIGWGTFLWVPLLVSAVYEGLELLATVRPAWRAAAGRALAVASVVALGAVLGYHARLGAYYLRVSEPVRLPGASLLQLTPSAASTLRVISRNAAAHADVLFSLPGTYSFNLWTGLPTPDQTNATHWFTLLSEPQQEKIIAALAAARDPVLIVHPQLVFSHLRPGFGSAGSLEKYVCAEFEPAVGLGPLSLWVRKGRHLAVLDSAELFRSAGGDGAETFMVSIVTDLSAAHALDHIDVAEFAGDEVLAQPAAVWNAANTRVDLMPIDLAGRQAGPMVSSAAWPLRGSGLVRLNLYLRTPPPAVTPDRLWLRFIDSEGRPCGEARFTKPGEGLPGGPAR